MAKCTHRNGVTQMGFFTAGTPMRAICGTCCLLGPSVYFPDDPIEAFWKMVNEQEKNMSEADYKRGVLDGTQPFPEPYMFPVNYSTEAINTGLLARRKKLLTKKVTKWFNVYNHGSQLNLSTCLWDSDIEARRDSSPYLIGTYPVEIEVEI
jgi:hypothetical protein